MNTHNCKSKKGTDQDKSVYTLYSKAEFDQKFRNYELRNAEALLIFSEDALAREEREKNSQERMCKPSLTHVINSTDQDSKQDVNLTENESMLERQQTQEENHNEPKRGVRHTNKKQSKAKKNTDGNSQSPATINPEDETPSKSSSSSKRQKQFPGVESVFKNMPIPFDVPTKEEQEDHEKLIEIMRKYTRISFSSVGPNSENITFEVGKIDHLKLEK